MGGIKIRGSEAVTDVKPVGAEEALAEMQAAYQFFRQITTEVPPVGPVLPADHIDRELRAEDFQVCQRVGKHCEIGELAARNPLGQRGTQAGHRCAGIEVEDIAAFRPWRRWRPIRRFCSADCPATCSYR